MMPAHVEAGVTAGLLALCLTGCGLRQPPSRYDHYCENAIAAVKTVRAPAEGRLDAVDRLAHCGRPGMVAAGELFSRARASHNTALFDQLLPFTAFLDTLLVDPLLSVAEDRGATVEARVTALLGLARIMRGEYYFGRRDLTGGFNELGEPAHGCGLGMMVTDQPDPIRLPDVDRERIRAAARRIRAEEGSHIDIRTAAACVYG
jgi:hypothetical protein